MEDLLPLRGAQSERVSSALEEFATQVDQAVRLANVETLGGDPDGAADAREENADVEGAKAGRSAAVLGSQLPERFSGMQTLSSTLLRT